MWKVYPDDDTNDDHIANNDDGLGSGELKTIAYVFQVLVYKQILLSESVIYEKTIDENIT